MIKKLVDYSILDKSLGTSNAIEKTSSLTLRYPCVNSSDCTPYKLVLKPSIYRFECWGSIGAAWSEKSSPGKGAYTRGTILLTKKAEMYIYVGAKGFFNSMKERKIERGYPCGGATDVRLESSTNWWDLPSLKSRIMVAAGGGGAEWDSFGGNGGELIGNSSVSSNSTIFYDKKCEGPTQTSGTNCPNYVCYGAARVSKTDSFGSAGVLDLSVDDWGGSGGGGYYGGSSYPYAFAGSGGSSFISGHEGCNALNKSEDIQHSNTPFHYSGFVFTDTLMIGGNKTMPLPFGSAQGIWENTEGGAFRISIISLNKASYYCQRRNNLNIISILIIMNSE